MIFLEILSLIVYSDFGIFKKPDINLNYLTYEFIPKPMILGILGAIAGFKGWNSQEEVPDFYNKLKDLRIGIEPLKLNQQTKLPYTSSNFLPRAGVIQKIFVTYNNYHGYGNERDNLIIKEQLLIKPAYRIFVEKDGCPDELKEKLKGEMLTSTYIPYMGKNEFLLSAILEGKDSVKNLTEDKVKINSLFFSDIIKNDNLLQEIEENVSFFNIYENYPYMLEGSHYLFKKVIYSNRKFEVDTNTIRKNGYLLVNINGKNIFLF